MLALPDMPLAFVGLGLLIAVVVSSLVAVRRRFSYEAWHVIHLLSYVAVIVGLPHQLSVGGVLATGTAQRVYWIALYVLALGAIVVFRFVKPIVSSLRHGMRVVAVQQVAPGVASIYLQGSSLRIPGKRWGPVLHLALLVGAHVVALASGFAVGGTDRHSRAHHRSRSGEGK